MHDESVRINSQRADIYRLLSACYCLPGKEFVEEGLADNLAAALEPVCPDAVPCAREMASALSSSDMERGILVDYSALFVGPFKLLAPPYGSVYLETERRVMGDSTIDAVLTYRKAGVELDADQQKDMPDNIAVELEFMYFLIDKEAEARTNSKPEEAAKYADLRKDFMKRHLGAWAFKFTEAVKVGAKNPFYKNLALCTETFLQQEMEKDAAVASLA
jgi:TorA maturation chaperone TorD